MEKGLISTRLLARPEIRRWPQSCSLWRIPMLSRTSAVCLVVLILFPFSAPFSTCDFAAVFPATIRHATLSARIRITTPARGTPSPMASLESSHALPLSRSATRTKFVASEVRALLPIAVFAKSPAYHGPVSLGFIDSPFASPLRI
jgi:hypothetical protein